MQTLILKLVLAASMLAALSACANYTADDCHDCSVEAPPQYQPAPSK